MRMPQACGNTLGLADTSNEGADDEQAYEPQAMSDVRGSGDRPSRRVERPGGSEAGVHPPSEAVSEPDLQGEAEHVASVVRLGHHARVACRCGWNVDVYGESSDDTARAANVLRADHLAAGEES